MRAQPNPATNLHANLGSLWSVSAISTAHERSVSDAEVWTSMEVQVWQFIIFVTLPTRLD
jgi:hypothetical protein